MIAGRCIDQLCSNAHAVAALSDASFEYVANPELSRGSLNVDRFSLVSKRRIARDDEEPTQFRQAGDKILRNPVGEIFLLGIAAHVHKRQYSNGRPLGGCPFSLARSRRSCS